MFRVLAVCCVVLAQSSSVQESAPALTYEQAVDAYRNGAVGSAIAALGRIPPEERSRGADRLIAQSRRSGRFEAGALVAALALQVETAVFALSDVAPVPVTPCGSRPPLATSGEKAVQGGWIQDRLLVVLQDERSQDDFVRLWYLLMISYLHGAGFVGRAAQCIDMAPPRLRAHPDMQLALGASHEYGWQQVKEADGEITGFSPDLHGAERAYRAAIDAAPGLQEARLRLGRVLTLQDRPADALAMLSTVRDPDPAFRYLAQLFQGEARERTHDYAGAGTAYQAAAALIPTAQSASMALVQLAHLQGRRVEAATRMREAALPARASDSGDPWLLYSRGIAWRTAGCLRVVRSIAQRR